MQIRTAQTRTAQIPTAQQIPMTQNRPTTTLTLPSRQSKPRSRGVTMVIDNGLPTGAFRDLVASLGEYVDLVKFGWGTALVTRDIEDKIAFLRAHDIRHFFGGTMFEKYVSQQRFDDFRVLCDRYDCSLVEVSNGTIDMGNEEKAGYIDKLAAEFTVISEVGFKDSEKSELLSPSRWIEYIHQDLHAGAERVILEARESATSGICRPDGRLRSGLIEDILDSGIASNKLVFEAPTKALQAYFVRRVGPEVNLGNIAFGDVLPLETLRLGLRSDTLLAV